MSIATEITRITGAKAALKTAINGKGGTVTDAMLLDAYAAQIDALSSSGGSAEYYRCASVDTTAKTWTGYKAVLTDGVYAFDTTVTTGLTYTSVTPVVGSIYSADALAIISYLQQAMPIDGLVFHAPLSSHQTTAATGQALTYNRSCTYETSYGVPCVKVPLDNTGTTTGITFPNTNIPVGSSPSTLSCWIRSASMWTNQNEDGFLIAGTEWRALGIGYSNRLYCVAGSGNALISSAHDYTKWRHVCAVVGTTSLKLYIDGILINSMSITLNTPTGSNSGLGTNRYSDIYLAGARIYNRELTDSDVILLSHEFNPIT